MRVPPWLVSMHLVEGERTKFRFWFHSDPGHRGLCAGHEQSQSDRGFHAPLDDEKEGDHRG